MTPAIDGIEYTKFITQNPNVTRGIVFAGCSFTWGQGLYYYSNLPSIREPQPNHFERALVNSSHIQFMESVRMPRLVANHFKTFEAVHPYNGGSDESILDFWERAFDPARKPFMHNHHRHMNDDGIFSVSDPWYDYDDFAYIVYQFTQLERTRFNFQLRGKTYHFNVHYARNGSQGTPEEMNAFIEWLLEQEMTYEQWQDLHHRQITQRVKRFLQNFEMNGVKARVTVWPYDGLKYVEEDAWLKERLVQFKYLNNDYNSYTTLMEVPEMKIDTDTRHFKVTPGDHHPSLMAQQVVADALIRSMDSTYIHRPRYE